MNPFVDIYLTIYKGTQMKIYINYFLSINANSIGYLVLLTKEFFSSIITHASNKSKKSVINKATKYKKENFKKTMGQAPEPALDR
jgi:hypothetical protein